MNIKSKLKLYKILHLIRFSQQYLIKMYHPEDKMRCPIHFCLGQEALASCLNFFLKKNDFLLSHHRSHGYYLFVKIIDIQFIRILAIELWQIILRKK